MSEEELKEFTCPNSFTGWHDFEVTGKNKEKAEKYGQVPCKYCGKLIPYTLQEEELE